LEITELQFREVENELLKVGDFDEREATLDELIEKEKWFVEVDKPSRHMWLMRETGPLLRKRRKMR